MLNLTLAVVGGSSALRCMYVQGDVKQIAAHIAIGHAVTVCVRSYLNSPKLLAGLSESSSAPLFAVVNDTFYLGAPREVILCLR